MKKVVGRRLGVPALLVALALLATAAAGTAAPVSKRSARDAGAVTLGLPGIPPVFLGVRPYVASQKGYYSKYGVNVTLKSFTTGTDAMRAVINGQIDAAWAPTPTALAAIAGGSPLVGIEGMDVVDWEIGSIDPAVKSCSDLKGQTIGVDTVGGARYNALVAMLSKCKLSINDVKTVNFPGAAGMNAQIAGQLYISIRTVRSHLDRIRDKTGCRRRADLTRLALAEGLV